MKTSTNQIEKSEIKKDSANLENVKIQISKGKKELANRETSVYAKKDLYLIDRDSMNSDQQKNFRNSIRRGLKRFVSDILGKDRSDESKEKSIQEFLEFYKKNWRITDFKIENFSQSKTKGDLRDYADLLEFVKSTIE